MIHDSICFFTIGRFCPSWVQAVAETASLFVSVVTLTALLGYVLDTGYLAKSGVEQIRIMQKDRGTRRGKIFNTRLIRSIECERN